METKKTGYRGGRPPETWYEKRYVAVDDVRPLVLKLEDHYGSLQNAGDAIGMAKRTLQNIKLRRYPRVTMRVLEHIQKMCDDPPPPAHSEPSKEEIRSMVISLVERYGGTRQAALTLGVGENTMRAIKNGRRDNITSLTAQRIHRAYLDPPLPVSPAHVPSEKVRPLVLFLIKAYGGTAPASRAVGVAESTLGEIKNEHKKYVTRPTALTFVKAVEALRHGDRTWSVYENEGPPRLASEHEKSLPRVIEKWEKRHD